MNIYSLICLFRGHQRQIIGVDWSADGAEVSLYECLRCRILSRHVVPRAEVERSWEITTEALADGRDLEIWRRQ